MNRKQEKKLRHSLRKLLNEVRRDARRLLRAFEIPGAVERKTSSSEEAV